MDILCRYTLCSRRVFCLGFLRMESRSRKPALGTSSIALNPHYQTSMSSVFVVFRIPACCSIPSVYRQGPGGYFHKDGHPSTQITGLLPRIGRLKQTGSAGTVKVDEPGFISGLFRMLLPTAAYTTGCCVCRHPCVRGCAMSLERVSGAMSARPRIGPIVFLTRQRSKSRDRQWF